ncbi:hypothetical protein SAMN04487934_101108 [Eubacterium ruminantium]|nr:hypothetical protein SAMN04487934_101108 [Eubacterium ruminantium]
MVNNNNDYNDIISSTRKTKKSNKRAVFTILFFIAVITTVWAVLQFTDLEDELSLKKKTDTPGSDNTITNIVASEDTGKSTEKPGTEAVTTENTTIEVTTEKTETTAKTDTETTEKTEDSESTEDTDKDTTESTEDCVLPPVSQIKGHDWYNAILFEPDTSKDAAYFDNTVLIGDSRTESLELYSGYDNITAFAYKGLNVGALKTESVIKLGDYTYTVEEAVNATRYDNYYISFGINELGWQYIDVFTDDISELIDIIYTRNPNAVVYVASVVPVSKSVSDEDDVFTLENVEKFNIEILKMVQNRGDVIYIDYAAAVRDEEGYLPEEGSVDGKHCTADYNKRIMEYILTHTYKRK